MKKEKRGVYRCRRRVVRYVEEEKRTETAIRCFDAMVVALSLFVFSFSSSVAVWGNQSVKESRPFLIPWAETCGQANLLSLSTLFGFPKTVKSNQNRPFTLHFQSLAQTRAG